MYGKQIIMMMMMMMIIIITVMQRGHLQDAIALAERPQRRVCCKGIKERGNTKWKVIDNLTRH